MSGMEVQVSWYRTGPAFSRDEEPGEVVLGLLNSTKQLGQAS